MIQAESREQMYKSHQITVTFRTADHHKEILTIALIDHRTQNQYFVQHTYETLPSIAKKCFQNIRQLYEKLLELIKKDNGDLIIEPNGVLIFKHMRKDRKCQSYVTIKTKLKQMNILTDSNQAIQLLFEKAKQNSDFVYQMKKLISNEIKEIHQKQSKKNQDQLQKMRKESSALRKQIQKLQKEISERCLKSQITQTVQNIDTELKRQIQDLRQNLHRNYEYIGNIQTKCENIDRTILMLQQKLYDTNTRLAKIKIDTLQLADMYQTQLKTQLQKYQNKFVDQVCIYNDRLQTAVNKIETIKQLSNLRNITKLQIKWCMQMKAQVSMEILKSMPQLKHLTLLLHRQKLSYNFMTKLCQFKQLTTFYLNFCSLPQYYISYIEDLRFIGYYSLKKDNLPQTKDLLELSRLPKLENIEISQINDTDSVQVIRNMKALKNLTLGYDWGQRNQLNGDLMTEVCKLTHLRTLSLVGVAMISKQLAEVVSKNKNLNTIISMNLYKNENIDDETVECMGNLIQLQTLCIYNNTAITGKGLSKLNSLKMLEIHYCENVNKMNIKEAITKMQKLQYLKLNYNSWIDDDVMMSVQSCKELKYLNIDSTSVSGEGVKHFEGLTQLSTLICSDTKIEGKDLIELTKHIPSINKLSIRNLQVHDNEFLEISENCSAITHLDVSGTEITVQALLKMKQLKLVNNNLNNEAQKKLSNAGIQNY